MGACQKPISLPAYSSVSLGYIALSNHAFLQACNAYEYEKAPGAILRGLLLCWLLFILALPLYLCQLHGTDL